MTIEEGLFTSVCMEVMIGTLRVSGTHRKTITVRDYGLNEQTSGYCRWERETERDGAPGMSMDLRPFSAWTNISPLIGHLEEMLNGLSWPPVLVFSFRHTQVSSLCHVK